MTMIEHEYDPEEYRRKYSEANEEYNYEYDSKGRPATKGAHPAKAQQDLDKMEWTKRQEKERARKHAKLLPKFKKPGTPVTKYHEGIPEMVYNWLTDREVIFTKRLVSAHIGVDESNFRRWLHIYPDLRAAVAQGLAVQEAWLASQMADGMKYSQSMYAVLKNLHGWRETQETTHKLGIGEALALQRDGAKRVNWDRTRPDPLAEQKKQAKAFIDARVVSPSSQSSSESVTSLATDALNVSSSQVDEYPQLSQDQQQSDFPSTI